MKYQNLFFKEVTGDLFGKRLNSGVENRVSKLTKTK
jgi:hypothetical protein